MRAYHNLEGWLRDVAAAMQEYETDPGGAGTSAFCRLLDVLRDCEEMVDAEDDADVPADDDSSDVDGDDASLREDDAPRARRPDARSQAHCAQASGLGRELADVPGSVRDAPEPVITDVRGGNLGAPRPGLSPRWREAPVLSAPTMVPVEARGVPRGTKREALPTTTRKARSRGKGVGRGKKSTRRSR